MPAMTDANDPTRGGVRGGEQIRRAMADVVSGAMLHLPGMQRPDPDRPTAASAPGCTAAHRRIAPGYAQGEQIQTHDVTDLLNGQGIGGVLTCLGPMRL